MTAICNNDVVLIKLFAEMWKHSNNAKTKSERASVKILCKLFVVNISHSLQTQFSCAKRDYY